MSYKLFLVLSVLFGLSLTVSIAEESRIRLRTGTSRKISKHSGEPLIRSACRGVGKYESECMSTLECASKSQKTDVNGLAFFALKYSNEVFRPIQKISWYVEDHAVNLTADIKKANTIPNLSPMLQAALSDCFDQYTPMGDLIEDAINAVLANAYSDAHKFIEAAISDIEVCDTKLKSSTRTKGIGSDVQLATNMNEYNCFLKSMLSAVTNVIKAR